MARMFHKIAMSIVAAALIGSPAASAETMTPLERVTSTPKGELKSPYADISAVAEQGRQIYRSLDCGGCHGGGGGGGMAPRKGIRLRSTGTLLTRSSRRCSRISISRLFCRPCRSVQI